MRKAIAMTALAGSMLTVIVEAGITGFWYTKEERAVVELKMDQNGVLTGRIVGLKEPLDDEGKPKTDIENPTPALRSRPVIGLLMLWDFQADGPGKWKNGRIYDPDNGKTYWCRLTLDGDRLHLRGSLDKWGLAGRTEVWTRRKP